MTLYARLGIALEQGLNLKLALMATGLDHKTFWQYYDERMFTNGMKQELELVLKEWNN